MFKESSLCDTLWTESLHKKLNSRLLLGLNNSVMYTKLCSVLWLFMCINMTQSSPFPLLVFAEVRSPQDYPYFSH